MERVGVKKQQGKRSDVASRDTSPTLGEVARALGVPRATAQFQLKAAEDYAAAAPEHKAKVDAGERVVALAAPPQFDPATTRRNRMRVSLLLPVLALQGCMTFSGDRLREIAPPAARRPVSIDFAVGDFRFEMDGGALRGSAGVGRDLNEEVAARWESLGYLSRYSDLGRDTANGASEYLLTLSGTLDGESPILLQIVSGLSLLVIPYYIDRKASLTYELRHRQTGQVWRTSVSEDSLVVGWLPFIVALPFFKTGQSHALDKMSRHLYAQFVQQGAFK